MGNKSYAELLAEVTEMHNKMEALQVELRAAKEAEENPVPPHPRWKPNSNELYYYITAGIVARTSWDGVAIDWNALNVGNVFMSSTAAEFAVERLKVIAAMSEWAGEWDDPYIIMYSGEEKVCHVHEMAFHFLNGGGMRFATQEDAENCIKVVGADRIIKYYFQIPE